MIIDKILRYIPFIFIIFLGHGLRRSHGALKSNHLIFISICLSLFIFSHLKGKIKFSKEGSGKWPVFIYTLFSVFLAINHEIIYAVDNWANYLIKSSFIINGLLSFLIFIKVFFNRNIKIKTELIYNISFGIILLNLTLTLFASPEPFVDVYTILRDSSHKLFEGLNPYIFEYKDIYNGLYSYVPYLIYWPVVVYGAAIGEFLIQDIRLLYLLCFVLTFWGLKKQYSGKLNLLIWGLFPVTFFVLEQSWVEIYLLPSFVFHQYFLRKKNILGAAIMLGLMCATKQFMIFTAIFSFIYILKTFSKKESIKYLLVSISTSLILMAPFLIMDAELFIDRSVVNLLNYDYRIDSLSWTAFFARFYKYYIPGNIISSIYLLTLVILSFYAVSKRFCLKNLMFVQVVMYMIVFLLGKQSFCNYYYFLTLFVYMYSYEVLEESVRQNNPNLS